MINSREIDRFMESELEQPQSYIIFEGENLSSKCKKISPDKDKIVILQGNSKRKNELEMKNKYLNENNFRLQIGKMQEDIETIYSNDLLRCGISYILKHVESNGKVVIQLWPTLAQKLFQHETGKIIDYNKEKLIIQELINNFGEIGKSIEIQDVAENYKDVFDLLENGKDGIIAEIEPQLEFPLKSPLNIIKFLAYNASKDKKMMSLFYGTKPEKYKKQDEQNLLHAGDSNADYYSIVEVGIRLYEILNGIHIQGGIDRQKVYDKIIGLILFGEDNISEKDKKLKIQDYPSLQKLNQWIIENFENIRMEQLYINTDKLDKAINKRKNEYKLRETNERITSLEHENTVLRTEISKNDKEIEILKQQNKQARKDLDTLSTGNEKNEKIKSFLKKSTIGLGIALTMGGSIYGVNKYDKSKQMNANLNNWEKINKKNTDIPVELINNFGQYFDLSSLKNDNRKKIEDLFEAYIIGNKNIIEGWSKGTIPTESVITDFRKIYGGYLIKEYNLSFKPYDLIKEYNSDIENTINCKPIEIPKKYTAETDGKVYSIGDKTGTSTDRSSYYITKVIVNDNGHKKHLLLASKDFLGPYTLYKGCEVISRKDLFYLVKRENPEIFDSLFDSQTVDDTKNQIKQGNFALNDIAKRKNYQKEQKGMRCTVYCQDDINKKIYKNIEQCPQETIKFRTNGIKTRNIRIGNEYYRLSKICIGSKEYLFAGNQLHGRLSINMLKKIDKKYLNPQEQIAYDNSINAGLNISGRYFENDLYNFYLDIFRSNYNFDFCGRNGDINYSEININGEFFSVCSINCGGEGNLLFAAKGKEGVYTLENGKIVAEYLKKFKDLQKKDI